MNKEISVKIAVTPILSEVDKFALTRAMDIARDLTELDGVLLNEQTGEVIEISELGRVLGILSGIRDTEEWVLQ